MRVDFNHFEATAIGQERQGQKGGYSTERFFDNANQEDITGVVGELAFETHYGYPMDRTIGFGDSGIDFVTPLGTVDMKTTTRPKLNLLVKAQDLKKQIPDFIVVAAWDLKSHWVEFLGFEHGIEILDLPVKSFRAGPSHYMPYRSLHPMWIFNHLLEFAEGL